MVKVLTRYPTRPHPDVSDSRGDPVPTLCLKSVNYVTEKERKNSTVTEKLHGVSENQTTFIFTIIVATVDQFS